VVLAREVVMSRPPLITKDTRVAELLRDYPETEELLINMAPPFKKLRNPLLRRSVARVATLSQAAVVARLPARVLVDRLRAAVGQPPLEGNDDDDIDYLGPRPDWFDEAAVVTVLDESQLDPDVMPINPLLRAAKELAYGEIVQLVTSHVPAPGIDVMRRKGYLIWTTAHGQEVRTYFTRGPTSPDGSHTSI
jgi:Domain of unknown function (DUF1858)